jgi:4-amino-4-deoxy-L-arabinose transferase-like glycosyltransferase
MLLYPCLGFHLFEPDEGRYAEIPREMADRDEWVVPYLQGEPYLDKPPLFYWLVMACYRVFGVHAWSARLVPALAIHGSILLVYFFGRRTLGERAALWGALFLGLAPAFVGMGRLLVLDGLLAWWVTLSVFCAFVAVRRVRLHWGWWLTAACACGMGILTKGPVALVLLMPPFWLQRWLVQDRCRISWAARLLFLGVILAVALPWYVAICLRLPHFAWYFLWQHNVIRFFAPFDHLEPIWYYAPILLGGLLPASLLLVPFLRYLASTEAGITRRRCPELGFLLLAGGWCLLFFSLSGCKLPTYILPAFPPLALALGYFVSTSSWHDSRWLRPLAGGAFLLLAVGHHILVPWYAGYRSPGGRLAELARFCGDRRVPVVCYPRSCETAGFYLRRDDLHSYRSKEIDQLRAVIRDRPRTIVLCTHRHSLQGLRQALPPEVIVVDETHFGLGSIPGVPGWLMPKAIRWAGETPLGLCDLAVIERRRQDGR